MGAGWWRRHTTGMRGEFATRGVHSDDSMRRPDRSGSCAWHACTSGVSMRRPDRSGSCARQGVANTPRYPGEIRHASSRTPPRGSAIPGRALPHRSCRHTWAALAPTAKASSTSGVSDSRSPRRAAEAAQTIAFLIEDASSNGSRSSVVSARTRLSANSSRELPAHPVLDVASGQQLIGKSHVAVATPSASLKARASSSHSTRRRGAESGSAASFSTSSPSSNETCRRHSIYRSVWV